MKTCLFIDLEAEYKVVCVRKFDRGLTLLSIFLFLKLFNISISLAALLEVGREAKRHQTLMCCTSGSIPQRSDKIISHWKRSKCPAIPPVSNNAFHGYFFLLSLPLSGQEAPCPERPAQRRNNRSTSFSFLCSLLLGSVDFGSDFRFSVSLSFSHFSAIISPLKLWIL